MEEHLEALRDHCSAHVREGTTGDWCLKRQKSTGSKPEMTDSNSSGTNTLTPISATLTYYPDIDVPTLAASRVLYHPGERRLAAFSWETHARLGKLESLIGNM